jgi:tyrosyl-DNA phosphodiesterase 2
MDKLIQEAIKTSEAMKKHIVPWKATEISPQLFHQFDVSKKTWHSLSPEKTKQHHQEDMSISKLALYSWNIDFMLPFAKPRMDAALDQLENLTRSQPVDTAVVIFLQECLASDLTNISEKTWVRERFYITDIDTTNWSSGYYGTTTLVDRRLAISSCFRVHYEKTRMDRDGAFVDLLMGSKQDKVIRLCNTHLESLALEPPFRPLQMELVAKYMHQVYGAAAAGDFNAIQPFDRTLHVDNNLKDAYLELGGKEDSEEGYTWGQQATTEQRQRFGCSRMDKVYFCGGLNLKKFARFGVDIQLTDESEREQILTLGFEKPWITDHLGIAAEFEVS